MKFLDRRSVVWVAVGLAALATTFAGTPAAPPTTTPPESEAPEATNFRRVDRFGPVAALLNLAQGTVRVIAIVPVDSASAFAMLDTVVAVVAANPSKRLRAYVILRDGGESSLRALILAARHSNPRVVYFWDPTGAVASVWDSGTSTVGAAWLYDTSAKFSDRPPTSALTVTARTSQEGTVLDGAALRSESDELVRRVEAKMAGTPNSGPTESP